MKIVNAEKKMLINYLKDVVNVVEEYIMGL